MIIHKRKKVIDELEKQLLECEEFMFVVAFATDNGVTSLLGPLEKYQKSGKKGTIILSGYQNFTEPKALEKLLKYDNIDLKMVLEGQVNLHSKGYIFKKGKKYTAIVGSSNLTQKALGANIEWNFKFDFTEQGKICNSIIDDFEAIKKRSMDVTEDFIKKYEITYREFKAIKERAKVLQNKIDDQKPVIANKMQEKALEGIKKIIDEKGKRALVCSATGTGKTILLALHVKEFKPKRFLFIVHREQICNAAAREFKKVLGKNIDIGIMSAGKTSKAQYTFATIQTISKDNILNEFKPDEFDYIAIDEVHRAGANSYLKVINHFKPKFLIGLSATPDRTDGFNIYELFHYNLAYEIRLRDALFENLVCPFHYFGVSDFTYKDDKGNYIEIDDKSDFNVLTSDERVKHILQKSQYYGWSGERVKGLIFVSRVEEAKELSSKFNSLGYKTEALSGEDTQEYRIKCVELLEKDIDDKENTNEEYLDYIFTVDIFNEGVDIPSINQVIMLRPTQSSIIFLQQLGRGLRKFKDKEYLVVIDFIANYDQNFMIPKALSEDVSGNKDNMRKFIFRPTAILPGASTIHFDEISKEKILKAIDRVNVFETSMLRKEYTILKNRLGRIPRHEDFKDSNVLDIERIVHKFGSYYNFLEKYDNEYSIRFNKLEEKYIQFISREYLQGKRPHELVLLKMILDSKGETLDGSFFAQMEKLYPGICLTKNTCTNILNQFRQEYKPRSEGKLFEDCIFIQDGYCDGEIRIYPKFRELLKNFNFKREIEEIIDFGFYKNKEKYSKRYKDTGLCLYEKYTYADVFKLLDWHKSEVSLNVGGYKYDKNTNTFPVFINYDKCESVHATIDYHDEFISSCKLKAISKNRRTMSSPDVQQIINAEANGTKIYLFVRKNKDDANLSKEFYFLGSMQYVKDSAKEFQMRDTDVNAVEFIYSLDSEVPDDLYDYLIG